MATVLIVDDCSIHLRLIHEVLYWGGFSSVCIASSREVLAYVRRKRPALILMDIRMPQEDGTALLKRLRADPCCCDIPVVALTAFAMKGDRELLLEQGFDDYLGKPLDSKVLLHLVAHYTSPKLERKQGEGKP